MRSEVLLVATRNRLPRIECRGAIQARCTAPDTVHLVSAAATPLGGDTIEIRVVVEAGACLQLRSAAASVALPGADTPTSQSRWEIDATGALDVNLEPTVVASPARHLSQVSLRVHDDGQVRYRERVQIGRSGEREGFWSGTLQADHGVNPVLRHRVELGTGSVADDVLSAPRAAINEFCYPATAFTEPADPTPDPGSTVLMLAAGGKLSTWQADRLTG